MQNPPKSVCCNNVLKKFEVPAPVKLVCGVLYGTAEWLQRALIDLPREFGDIDFRSESLEFIFTDYYHREMGQPLYRSFVSFHPLIDPMKLAEIKVFTNALEAEYSAAGRKRVLNLDPGYLNATAYILATSKNYAHRIYLGNGVFAQQELLFERKRIRTLDWTYPDYRSVQYQAIFRGIRESYLEQLRSSSHGNFLPANVSNHDASG